MNIVTEITDSFMQKQKQYDLIMWDIILTSTPIPCAVDRDDIIPLIFTYNMSTVYLYIYQRCWWNVGLYYSVALYSLKKRQETIIIDCILYNNDL